MIVYSSEALSNWLWLCFVQNVLEMECQIENCFTSRRIKWQRKWITTTQSWEFDSWVTIERKEWITQMLDWNCWTLGKYLELFHFSFLSISRRILENIQKWRFFLHSGCWMKFFLTNLCFIQGTTSYSTWKRQQKPETSVCSSTTWRCTQQIKHIFDINIFQSFNYNDKHNHSFDIDITNFISFKRDLSSEWDKYSEWNQ